MGLTHDLNAAAGHTSSTSYLHEACSLLSRLEMEPRYSLKSAVCVLHELQTLYFLASIQYDSVQRELGWETTVMVEYWMGTIFTATITLFSPLFCVSAQTQLLCIAQPSQGRPGLYWHIGLFFGGGATR